jgi:hypothetical protein
MIEDTIGDVCMISIMRRICNFLRNDKFKGVECKSVINKKK